MSTRGNQVGSGFQPTTQTNKQTKPVPENIKLKKFLCSPNVLKIWDTTMFVLKATETTIEVENAQQKVEPSLS